MPAELRPKHSVNPDQKDKAGCQIHQRRSNIPPIAPKEIQSAIIVGFGNPELSKFIDPEFFHIALVELAADTSGI